ncbi:anti-sigma factor [Achromobacter sp. GG226]|uniref:anti-sigma factor n=1 Tax=Verticiella alkaliphila TaxID=2779529 RepID=UPI001C0CE7AC|nr:anti-sigma factor [Verticiella sp. GG226]MBU4609047.1 anti-sigma factor [Verticiella sp. GG226]
MNYRDPELRDKLAADYVSGVMRRGARRRFERLLRDDADLRRTVLAWEERLYPLIEALPPEMPRDEVWQNIRRRLRARDRTQSAWGFSGVNFWRVLSGGLAAALVAVVVTGQQVAPESAPTMAVLQDGEARAGLVVAAMPDGAVRVHALASMSRPEAGRVFELWGLPASGAPRSLGLLTPEGRMAQASTMDTSAFTGLAVSVEPTGGSPTGAPTGPVILSGNLLHL